MAAPMPDAPPVTSTRIGPRRVVSFGTAACLVVGRVVGAGEVPPADGIEESPPGGGRAEEEVGGLPPAQQPAADEVPRGRLPTPGTEPGHQRQVVAQPQRLA